MISVPNAQLQIASNNSIASPVIALIFSLERGIRFAVRSTNDLGCAGSDFWSTSGAINHGGPRRMYHYRTDPAARALLD